MTERHHYKYVVLDSSKENGNAVQARSNVQIPHGITNASRVCVKSFSMSNVIHSVYGDLKTVRFVEFYRPTAGGNWVYEIFRFTLPDGYDETADLVNSMQAKFTNNEVTRESDGTATFTHPGQTDTPTTVTITHDTSSYKNTLVFNSGSQHKAIALLVEDQNSHTIWESLGFKKAQILKVNDIVDIVGSTALDIAAAFDQIAAINALVDAGADLNTQSENGPPMCIAAETGHTAAVMALIHAGADMNLTELRNGYTPLHLAVCQGSVACIAVLIQAGADIFKVNDHEMTPLDVAVEGLVLAVEGEYEEIAKLLRAAANFQAKSPV